MVQMPFVFEVVELKVVISRFAVQSTAKEESSLKKAIESIDWEWWKMNEVGWTIYSMEEDEMQW